MAFKLEPCEQLSATSLLQLSPAQVARQLKNGGLPSGTRYGIEAYRVIYCTVSSSYRPTIASGLLVLPQGRRGTLSLVSYDQFHGREERQRAVVPGHRRESASLLLLRLRRVRHRSTRLPRSGRVSPPASVHAGFIGGVGVGGHADRR